MGVAISYTLGESVSSTTCLSERLFVRMLSSQNCDGIDWYLFKVEDEGQNRFYMKTFVDLEELHAALLEAAPHCARNISLPELPTCEISSLDLAIGRRSTSSIVSLFQVDAYVNDLMGRNLSSSQ